MSHCLWQAAEDLRLCEQASLITGQQQAFFVEGRYTASTFGARPDFPALAAAFGMACVDLDHCRDARGALAAALRAPGPALVRLAVDPDAHVYPMVPPGAANHEMILEGSHAKA